MPREDLIQFRRGTAAQWTSANPTLASGEMGFETDTKRTKIGDGSTVWASLQYQAQSFASTPIENTYADITALLAGQGSQTTGFLQKVLDASADPNITSGRAYYEKLASTTGTLATDYTLLTEEQAEQIESSGGYSVNVLDFIGDEAERLKVIERDVTQDNTVITQAINDAFTYCIDNGYKELNFGDGLYIVDKVTVNSLDNFILSGHGSEVRYNSGNAIFEFTACENWEIKGFNFTSSAVAYADVAFLRVSTNSGFFNIHNCIFSNMPRCGIRANSLAGGTFTYGIQVHDCTFLDTANYSNDNQCGIELAGDGEYSKIHHNIFQAIPSAIRMVDGANSEFSFNTCMEMNGDAYDASYTNGIVFCNQVSNSGKIDILYNKINHNDTGMVAIVCKGDATKPQNPFKVIGNDILVNNSGTKTQAVYFKDAPNSVFKDNKMRGNSASPNDTAVVIEDSDFLIMDGNYINYYANGVELITSDQVKIGNQNIFENISTDKFVIDSGSIDVDCETFAFAISGYGSDVTVDDTSPKWMPYDCWLVNYWVSAGVAPVGSSLSVGFELNDVSQVSVNASIDTAENTSLTGTNPTLSTNDLVVGDKVMFPITAIGSTTAGQDVTVYMKVIRV